jgi:hypothetical protein
VRGRPKPQSVHKQGSKAWKGWLFRSAPAPAADVAAAVAPAAAAAAAHAASWLLRQPCASRSKPHHRIISYC